MFSETDNKKIPKMHIVKFVIGAAIALPALCLGAPIEAIPNSLNQRIESMSSGGPLEARSDKCGPDVPPPQDEASCPNFGIIIKRDSETDEVPAEPGVFI